MIALLNEIRYDIDYEEVLKNCSNGVIGRRDIAKLLVLKKYFETEDLVIKELFAKGKPVYFKTKSKSIEECISAIKESGGFAVIAHPWTLNLNIEQLKEFILKYKLDRIEVYKGCNSNLFSLISLDGYLVQ